jgi:hypothetical protein
MNKMLKSKFTKEIMSCSIKASLKAMKGNSNLGAQMEECIRCALIPKTNGIKLSILI